MSKQPVPIAYIVEKFPSLTQTFVYREVLALRERGLRIHPFSIWPADAGNLSKEALSLVEDTTNIFPLSWISFVLIHFRYFFSRPFCYLKTLGFIVFQPGEPMRNRWRSLRHFGYGMAALRKMERLNIRHIHVHSGGSASSIALIANRFLGMSFSLTLHAHGIFINRLLLKAKIRYCRFMVTISEYNRRYLKRFCSDDVMADKIHIVHCGLDADIFTPALNRSYSSGKLIIVGIGQLDPRKGFHVLVEACSILVERGVPFHCHILGEGPERGRIEAAVNRFRLHDHVSLPGRITQEELRRLLASADVSVLPCIWDESGDLDGIPVALMETMAMEIPSVSSNISGIPELIDHERNGLLTEAGDAAGLADAIQRLNDDPELRKKLGRAGREKVIDDFNIEKSTNQMSALFEQIENVGETD